MGIAHLLWTTPEELVAYGEQAQEVMKEAAVKYLIAPGDYSKYSQL